MSHEGFSRAAAGPKRGREARVASLAAVVVLTGCAVGPNYQRPKVNTPPAFRGAEGAAQQASFADLPWWDIFKDDTLKGLIKTALANNYDLGIAVSRVEQARQAAAVARSEYFPTVDYQGRVGGGRNQLFTTPQANPPGFQGLAIAVASASWEVDLWGRIRRLNEAARAQYLGTEDARRGVMLTLVADVSSAYFRLLGLQRQLEIAVQSEDSFNQTRLLFTQRMEGGISSQLPVSRITAIQATSSAQVLEFQRQIALAEDQLSVLLGQNPGAIPVKAKLLETTVPPEVPAGLPSALLERRPDVRAAEQTIRAANAQIGVATADFFPKIGLTTFFGKLAIPIDNFSSSMSTLSSFGATMSGPIFQGGKLTANKRQAVAEWQQAKLQYQQAALNAFRDSADALISRSKYEEIRVAQMKAVESYEDAFKLANTRFEQGFSSYFEVLDTQQQLYPALSALAQTEVQRRLVIIELYRALGGGWNLTDEQFASGGTP